MVRRVAATLLVLTLVSAACGDDDDGAWITASTSAPGPPTSGSPSPPTTQSLPSTTPPDATSQPPTTATLPPPTNTTAPPPPPPTTTTATTTVATTAAPPPPPTTTTTAPPPPPPEPTYSVDTGDFFPDPFPGSGGAHGSGCVADPGTLPNGVWFGFAEGFAGGTVTFDLACFFTGAQAEAEAAADGTEAFDFYIRNQNPATYGESLAADVRVWFVDGTSTDVMFPTEIPPGSWPHPDSYLSCPGDYCSVWLYVNGGRVTALVEQYLP